MHRKMIGEKPGFGVRASYSWGRPGGELPPTLHPLTLGCSDGSKGADGKNLPCICEGCGVSERMDPERCRAQVPSP